MSAPGAAPAPDDERLGFHVAFGVYLFMMLSIAVYAFFRYERRGGGKSGAQGKEIQAHFFANNSFGWAMLFLTTFSTVFSGYTVVALPSEASKLGYVSVGRWMVGASFMGISLVPIIPRFRRLCKVRNYQSPNDLFADRYNFRPLTCAVVLCTTVPLLIYVVAQLRALEDTICIVSNGVMDGRKAMMGLAAFIFVCEILGGMASVTMTDMAQSLVMLFAFVAGGFVLQYRYGGLAGVTPPDCEGGAEGGGANTSQCLAITAPYLVLYPGNGESDMVARTGIAGLAALDASPYFNYVATDMFSFGLSFLGLSLSPHWMMKIMMARSDADVRRAQICMLPTMWMALFPSACLGIVKAALFPPTEEPCTSPFGTMVAHYMDAGGFQMFISIMMCCSAIAAIMSTADSALLAFSNVLLIDIGRNWAARDMSARVTTMLSHLTSLLCMVGAVAWAIDLADDADSYGKLIRYQFGTSMQLLPGTIAALWVGPRGLCGPACFAGVVAGLVALLGIELTLVEDGEEIYSNSAVWSCLVNVAVAWAAQGALLACGLHTGDATRAAPLGVAPAVRQRWGAAVLGVDDVEEAMRGSTEPLRTCSGVAAYVVNILLVILACPWYYRPYREFERLSVATGVPRWLGWEGECEDKFCVDQVNYIAGIPDWAFGMIMCALGCTVCSVVSYFSWTTLDESKEKQVTFSGAAPGAAGREMAEKTDPAGAPAPPLPARQPPPPAQPRESNAELAAVDVAIDDDGAQQP